MTGTTTTPAPTTPAFGTALRRLYLVRFAFALGWAALLLATTPSAGLGAAALLAAYPLLDAAAVTWQIRSRPSSSPSASERTNVAVSLAVAITLAVVTLDSISTALVVWGAWAVGAGLPQLLTAIRHRTSGGQVAQMLSGGISVLAGASFVRQGATGGDDVAGLGGYAALGGLFFLASALRLGALQRRLAA